MTNRKQKVVETCPYRLVIKISTKGISSPVKCSLLYQIMKQNLDLNRKSIIIAMIKFYSLERNSTPNFCAFHKIDSKYIRKKIARTSQKNW